MYVSLLLLHNIPFTLLSLCTLNAAPYPPPEKIFLSLVNFRMKEITFTWSTVTSGCPTVHYNILASNCGSCPTTTNHTTVTCTDVPTDNRMCTFAIRTVVCTNIIGNVSKPLKFNVSETFNKMMHHHSKGSYMHKFYITCLALCVHIL